MQQSEWRHPGEKTKTSDQGKQQDCQLIDLCPRLNIANNRSLLMDSEWSKGALMVKAYFPKPSRILLFTCFDFFICHEQESCSADTKQLPFSCLSNAKTSRQDFSH